MKVCENCGKEHDGSYGSGRFCSKECAKSYSSKSLDNTNKKLAKCIDCGTPIFISKRASTKNCKCKVCKNKHTCAICGKEYAYIKGQNTINFCSKECQQEYHNNKKKYLSEDAIYRLSEAGKKSANSQKDVRRSKNEIEFCKLCESKFDLVRHNESIFDGWDADILIYDIKFAILWNGKWHYEKITKQHSVEQVQNRDKIKIKEIQKHNWTPYIIKDMGKYNLSFVKQEFDKLLKYTSRDRLEVVPAQSHKLNDVSSTLTPATK